MESPTRQFAGIDTSTPVVLFIMYHHIGMGIVRSLGRLGITVHAIEPDKKAPGLYSRYLTGNKYFWNVHHEPTEATVEYLMERGRALGRRAILIPTTDELSIMTAEHADTLREWYIMPDMDAGLCKTLASKKDMYFLARRHRIPTPAALFPVCSDEVRAFASTAQFPIMLKGIDGNLLVQKTGKKMFIVRTAEELITLYERCEDPEHPNLMLQEYIPGGDDSVWMFNGYFNRESECLFGVTGKKIRQAPVYTGYTSLGVCMANHTVAETTRRFMKEIGYRGILDIGYRFDIRDGQYKVLDINPRIGASFRLFVGENGLDVARSLYLDLTGQTVPSTNPIEGRKWMVEERDIVSTIRYLRDRKLTIGAWLRSFRGVQESAWFAADDLLPFFVMWKNFLLTPFRKLRVWNPDRAAVSSGTGNPQYLRRFTIFLPQSRRRRSNAPAPERELHHS